MKTVLFIYPTQLYVGEIKKHTRFTDVTVAYKPVAPLGVLYVIEALRQRGVNAIFLDNCMERWDTAKVLEYIASVSPDMVGFSGTFAESAQAREIARSIRGRIPTVYGGANAKARPEWHAEHFDHVCGGEGCNYMLDLLGLEPIEQPFETLLPARDVLDIDRYCRTANPEAPGPVDMAISSVGCPFSCRFCASVVIDKKYQPRSIESVEREVLALKRDYGTKTIYFRDDNALPTIARGVALGEMLQRNGLKWIAQSRVTFLTRENIRALKGLGCVMLNAGFESVNDASLQYIGKKFKAADVYAAIDALESEEMPWTGGFIVGMPDEDAADVRRTLEFVKACKRGKSCRLVKKPAMRFVGYPISETYNELVRDGLVEYSWQAGEYLLARTRHLSVRDVDAIMSEY